MSMSVSSHSIVSKVVTQKLERDREDTVVDRGLGLVTKLVADISRNFREDIGTRLKK